MNSLASVYRLYIWLCNMYNKQLQQMSKLLRYTQYYVFCVHWIYARLFVRHNRLYKPNTCKIFTAESIFTQVLKQYTRSLGISTKPSKYFDCSESNWALCVFIWLQSIPFRYAISFRAVGQPVVARSRKIWGSMSGTGPK